jgi:hypothetical protein
MSKQLHPTAFSKAGICFICRVRNAGLRRVQLHRIPYESVKEVYLKRRIIIKTHARFCLRHLDEDGFLRKEEFRNIPTRLLPVCSTTIRLLDSFASFRPKPFEKFKDMRTLTKKHCKFITGWSKKTFIRFCTFITSINETERRNKEQLVALYRFWLRKGTTQAVLASMFDNQCTQNKIS